jgi:hypothetical protein
VIAMALLKDHGTTMSLLPFEKDYAYSQIRILIKSFDSEISDEKSWMKQG